jgi:hypothetical protein
MKQSSLNALVKAHNGWWEEGSGERIARFPTPHDKDQFLKALKEAKE